MLNVVVMIDHLDVGGTQQVLLNLIKGSKARGIGYTVICLQARGQLSDQLEKHATVLHLGYHRYNPLALFGLLAAIRRIKPQVIQVMLLKACILGACLAKMTAYPIVMAPRGAMTVEANRAFFPTSKLAQLYTMLFPRLANWAAAVVVQTQEEANFYQRQGVASHKLHVIHNGLDTQLYEVTSDQRQRLRTAWGLTEHLLLITQIGRLSPEKDPLTLLQAFHQISEPAVHLYFVGEGSERAALEEYIQKHDLSARVQLLGYRDDTPAILAASDLLALSSFSDAFPNVILEAWGAGIAVVATDCQGPREMIEPDLNGLLVPRRNPQALSDALQKLLADPALRQRLAIAGRQKLLENYTLTLMQSRFEQLYRTLTTA